MTFWFPTSTRLKKIRIIKVPVLVSLSCILTNVYMTHIFELKVIVEKAERSDIPNIDKKK